MYNNTFESVINGAVENAKSIISTEKEFAPVIISLGNDGVVSPTMIGPDMTEKDIKEILQLQAKTSKGLLYIVDVNISDATDDKEIDPEEDPKATTDLVCFAYEPGRMRFRRITYVRDGEGNPTFMDLGWKTDVKVSTGIYNNPFNKAGT